MTNLLIWFESNGFKLWKVIRSTYLDFEQIKDATCDPEIFVKIDHNSLLSFSKFLRAESKQLDLVIAAEHIDVNLLQ